MFLQINLNNNHFIKRQNCYAPERFCPVLLSDTSPFPARTELIGLERKREGASEDALDGTSRGSTEIDHRITVDSAAVSSIMVCDVRGEIMRTFLS
jgi:hypothetical protein